MMEEGAKLLEGELGVMNAPSHSLSLMLSPLRIAALLTDQGRAREFGRHWSLGWSLGAGMGARAQKRRLS